MNSEHQDGKTEPAFKATGWDFGPGDGSFSFAPQLHEAFPQTCNKSIDDF